MEKEREYKFTSTNFNFIRELVAEETGISLSEGKSDMVYSRLSRRLRQLDIASFDDYCRLLKNPAEAGDEIIQFVNAITTNLTSFFRENHHFEFLKKTLLPEIVKYKTEKKIRIWSAGCSTGEEPYSIAMIVDEFMQKHKGWDIKILATDLDSNVVAKASAGVYDSKRLEGISDSKIRKYFSKNRNTDSLRAKDSLRELITFKELNLMNDWPFNGPFDFIFCRNVVIYFNKETQRVLFDRYADILKPKGHVFIGHSESLFKVSNRFKLLGQTIYQKND